MKTTNKQFIARVLACCGTEAEREQVTNNEDQILELSKLVDDEGFAEGSDEEDAVVDLVAAHVVTSVNQVVAKNIRLARHSGPMKSLKLIAAAIPEPAASMVRAAEVALRASTSSVLEEFFTMNFAGSSPEMFATWKKNLSPEAIDQIVKGMKSQEDAAPGDLFKSTAAADAAPKVKPAAVAKPDIEVNAGVEVNGKKGKVIASNATSCMVRFADGATVQVPKSKIVVSASAAQMAERRRARLAATLS